MKDLILNAEGNIAIGWIIITVAILAIVFLFYFLFKAISEINDKEEFIDESADELYEDLEYHISFKHAKTDNAKEYLKGLKAMPQDQKELYEKVKNALCAYKNLDNKLRLDAESFKLNDKIIAMISVRDEELVLHIKLSNKDLKERFAAKPAEFQKYKTTLMPLPISTVSGLRVGTKLIENLAKEIKMEKNPSYHMASFERLIKF